ncbi:hypothetical protein ABK040_005165 [Willaertia magna]
MISSRNDEGLSHNNLSSEEKEDEKLGSLKSLDQQQHLEEQDEEDDPLTEEEDQQQDHNTGSNKINSSLEMMKSPTTSVGTGTGTEDEDLISSENSDIDDMKDFVMIEGIAKELQLPEKRTHFYHRVFSKKGTLGKKGEKEVFTIPLNYRGLYFVKIKNTNIVSGISRMEFDTILQYGNFYKVPNKENQFEEIDNDELEFEKIDYNKQPKNNNKKNSPQLQQSQQENILHKFTKRLKPQESWNEKIDLFDFTQNFTKSLQNLTITLTSDISIALLRQVYYQIDIYLELENVIIWNDNISEKNCISEFVTKLDQVGIYQIFIENLSHSIHSVGNFINGAIEVGNYYMGGNTKNGNENNNSKNDSHIGANNSSPIDILVKSSTFNAFKESVGSNISYHGNLFTNQILTLQKQFSENTELMNDALKYDKNHFSFFYQLKHFPNTIEPITKKHSKNNINHHQLNLPLYITDPFPVYSDHSPMDLFIKIQPHPFASNPFIKNNYKFRILITYYPKSKFEILICEKIFYFGNSLLNAMNEKNGDDIRNFVNLILQKKLTIEEKKNKLFLDNNNLFNNNNNTTMEYPMNALQFDSNFLQIDLKSIYDNAKVLVEELTSLENEFQRCMSTRFILSEISMENIKTLKMKSEYYFLKSENLTKLMKDAEEYIFKIENENEMKEKLKEKLNYLLNLFKNDYLLNNLFNLDNVNNTNNLNNNILLLNEVIPINLIQTNSELNQIYNDCVEFRKKLRKTFENIKSSDAITTDMKKLDQYITDLRNLKELQKECENFITDNIVSSSNGNNENNENNNNISTDLNYLLASLNIDINLMHNSPITIIPMLENKMKENEKKISNLNQLKEKLMSFIERNKNRKLTNEMILKSKDFIKNLNQEEINLQNKILSLQYGCKQLTKIHVEKEEQRERELKLQKEKELKEKKELELKLQKERELELKNQKRKKKQQEKQLLLQQQQQQQLLLQQQQQQLLQQQMGTVAAMKNTNNGTGSGNNSPNVTGTSTTNTTTSGVKPIPTTSTNNSTVKSPVVNSTLSPSSPSIGVSNVSTSTTSTNTTVPTCTKEVEVKNDKNITMIEVIATEKKDNNKKEEEKKEIVNNAKDNSHIITTTTIETVKPSTNIVVTEEKTIETIKNDNIPTETPITNITKETSTTTVEESTKDNKQTNDAVVKKEEDVKTIPTVTEETSNIKNEIIQEEGKPNEMVNNEPVEVVKQEIPTNNNTIEEVTTVNSEVTHNNIIETIGDSNTSEVVVDEPQTATVNTNSQELLVKEEINDNCGTKKEDFDKSSNIDSATSNIPQQQEEHNITEQPVEIENIVVKTVTETKDGVEEHLSNNSTVTTPIETTSSTTPIDSTVNHTTFTTFVDNNSSVTTPTNNLIDDSISSTTDDSSIKSNDQDIYSTTSNSSSSTLPTVTPTNTANNDLYNIDDIAQPIINKKKKKKNKTINIVENGVEIERKIHPTKKKKKKKALPSHLNRLLEDEHLVDNNSNNNNNENNQQQPVVTVMVPKKGGDWNDLAVPMISHNNSTVVHNSNPTHAVVTNNTVTPPVVVHNNNVATHNVNSPHENSNTVNNTNNNENKEDNNNNTAPVNNNNEGTTNNIQPTTQPQQQPKNESKFKISGVFNTLVKLNNTIENIGVTFNNNPNNNNTTGNPNINNNNTAPITNNNSSSNNNMNNNTVVHTGPILLDENTINIVYGYDNHESSDDEEVTTAEENTTNTTSDTTNTTTVTTSSNNSNPNHMFIVMETTDEQLSSKDLISTLHSNVKEVIYLASTKSQSSMLTTTSKSEENVFFKFACIDNDPSFQPKIKKICKCLQLLFMENRLDKKSFFSGVAKKETIPSILKSLSPQGDKLVKDFTNLMKRKNFIFNKESIEVQMLIQYALHLDVLTTIMLQLIHFTTLPYLRKHYDSGKCIFLSFNDRDELSATIELLKQVKFTFNWVDL